MPLSEYKVAFYCGQCYSWKPYVVYSAMCLKCQHESEFDWPEFDEIIELIENG